jgi:RNA polymerase sigma-70 factor (ECF subfamily)
MSEHSGKLVARWQAGDQQAAAELFRRYAGRLAALARTRLSRQVSRRVDPDDVVQSVYRSFFDAARDGQFDLERGGNLWRLLVTITLNKIHNQRKRNERLKRGVQREQAFGSEDSLFNQDIYLLAREPSPSEAAAVADELEGLMRKLEPLERRILELRLQGCKLEEIAAAIDRSERTVRRVLEEVKQQLEHGSSKTASS